MRAHRVLQGGGRILPGCMSRPHATCSQVRAARGASHLPTHVRPHLPPTPKVLAKAISKGTDEPVNDYLKMTNKKKVLIRDINPKSVSTQELYGFVNMATREWKVRSCHRRPDHCQPCGAFSMHVWALTQAERKPAFPNSATLQDGQLSYNMRELANMPDQNPKWILLVSGQLA